MCLLQFASPVADVNKEKKLTNPIINQRPDETEANYFEIRFQLENNIDEIRSDAFHLGISRTEARKPLKMHFSMRDNKFVSFCSSKLETQSNFNVRFNIITDRKKVLYAS